MPHLPEPVAAFVDAVNRHDETAFLDAFVDGGHVDDWGRVFTGRDAIAQWSAKEFIGSDPVLTPRSVEVTAEGKVVVVGDWSSTHANGLSSFAFTLAAPGAPDTQGETLPGTIVAMVIREGEA